MLVGLYVFWFVHTPTQNMYTSSHKHAFLNKKAHTFLLVLLIHILLRFTFIHEHNIHTSNIENTQIDITKQWNKDTLSRFKPNQKQKSLLFKPITPKTQIKNMKQNMYPKPKTQIENTHCRNKHPYPHTHTHHTTKPQQTWTHTLYSTLKFTNNQTKNRKERELRPWLLCFERREEEI